MGPICLVCIYNLTHTIGPNRVLRAFLIEEQKIVKRVLKLQEQETVAAATASKKKKSGPAKKKAVAKK
jgi:hypothetical protein